jgi:hypothetical protein
MAKSQKHEGRNRDLVNQSGDSTLSPDFSELSKPAQRALANSGIHTPADLAKRTLNEIGELHGVGPSAFPILRKVLRKNGLSFKSLSKR